MIAQLISSAIVLLAFAVGLFSAYRLGRLRGYSKGYGDAFEACFPRIEIEDER